MSTTDLRKRIKKSIDKLPKKRLRSVADFVAFVSRPKAEVLFAPVKEEVRVQRTVKTRKVRKDA